MPRLALLLGALAVAVAVALGASLSGARPTASVVPRVKITIDDFSRGAAGWKLVGSPHISSRSVGGDPLLSLRRGSMSRELPRASTLSFDLRLSRGAKAELDLGAAGVVKLQAVHGRLVAGRGERLHRSHAPQRWYRVEAATAKPAAAFDGEAVPTAEAKAPGMLSINVIRGRVDLRTLLIGSADDPGVLLLHRLAFIHTRTPHGKFPIGTGLDSRLRFSRGWTSGFWPGSLWHAFDLTNSPMFERWALAATLENFGREHADTHDLGFMYETSSVTAYRHLCGRHAGGEECSRLKRSALAAADSLLALAATNEAAGTIPTSAHSRCPGCSSPDESDTIVDSVMNLQLLFWASRVTGDARYRDVAARHAKKVADLMVRSDGSTWSSVHMRRSDGAVIRYHTHQGYRDDSTWARGQAWAIYGFAAAAEALEDRGLLDTSERTARYVMTRLPHPAIPLYDYDAPATAPHDVSAGIISAAGMLQLASACGRLRASCDPSPATLRTYARGMLTASFAQLGRTPPLGFLGHQVYGLGGVHSWDDDAELTFGLNYALESIAGGA